MRKKLWKHLLYKSHIISLFFLFFQRQVKFQSKMILNKKAYGIVGNAEQGCRQ